MPYLQVKPVAIGENEANRGFTVVLSAASSTEVRVNYDTLNASAVSTGSFPDFVRKTGTLVFAPGETSKFVPLALVNDTVAEATELLWFKLSDAVNATIQQELTPGLLFDNDAPAGKPLVQVLSEPVIDERAGTATYTVWLDKPSTTALTLNWTLAADSADSSDVRAAAGTLNFAAGETMKTITVDVLDDSRAEPDEVFKLVLSNGATGSATIVDVTTTTVIAASDAAPVATPYISAERAATDEFQVMTGFTVRLSAPSTSEVRVSFKTLDATAESTGTLPDFQATSGMLVFAPGETAHFVQVPLFDDIAAENNALFWLELSNPVGGVVTQRLTPGLIIDNDSSIGSATPNVLVGDAVVDERAGYASFVIRLDRPPTTLQTLNYTTVSGSAVAGEDFRAVTDSVQFAPGEMLATVRVPLLADALTEPDEFFSLVVSGVSADRLIDPVGVALIGANSTAPVLTPAISARSTTVGEADVQAIVMVQLSAPSTREVRVDFDMANGNANFSTTAPDFQRYIGTLVFAPGETTKTLPVALVNDLLTEGPETFTVSLSAPFNATLAQATATVTILDDDIANSPVLSYGLSNDLYIITTGRERIAESPHGGIDTVKSSVSFTLPDNLENLLLSGAASNANGNAGNNIFRGTPQANTIDGREGIDTMIFTGPRANYSFTNVTATGRDATSAAEGKDRLNGIERFQFTDTISAEDTRPGGHTYAAYAMWNAAFNKAPSTQELSRWTATLDQLDGDTRALAQVMINTYAPGVSDAVLVSYLWGTLVGGTIPADQLASYTGQLAAGIFSQASLLELVSTLDVNTVEIAAIVGRPIALDPAFFPIPG